MPKKHSTLKIKDDYFIVLGKKDENEEVQEGYLNELECPERHRQLFFWPDDLLSIAVSDEQMTSAQVEILEVLCSRPQKIEKLLEPNEKQLDKWNKRRTEDVSALAIRAQKRVNGFRYTKGDDASSPMLLIRIDDVIDQSRRIRKKIESLLSVKEWRDTGTVEEDEGVLPDEYKRTEVTEKPTERLYYPSQIFLANQIVERIDVIYDHYHNSKSFENFDFYIYTANMNMLEDQTCSRLSKKESECFPESLYEGSDIKARKRAKEKVFKYQQKTVDEQFREMCSRVEKEPNTLFLIVADEAHWGATEGDKANSTLTNNWNANDHPNVVLLQVTATPYNLLTENTRLPTAYYKCQDNGKYEVKREEEIYRSTKLHNFKLLHQVKWTDNFKSKVKKGIIVKLRVPLPGKDKSPAQLYTKPPEKKDDFLPWYGLMLTKTYPNYTSEFLMQGNENDVTISTKDGKWILVVRDNQVGFICRPTSHSYGRLAEDISSFSILDGYGEGLFLLKVKGNDGRERHLVYSDTSQMIQLSARGAPVEAKDEDLPSLNASFLIEQCRSKESLGPEKEYISLIYYFNSMRNEEPKDQLIRDDLYFDELVTHITKNKMTQKFDADDILIVEYSYYIILINLQRTYPLKLTSISQCFENLEECAGDYLKKREEYKNKFITELGKHRSEKDIRPIKPTAFKESLRLLSKKVKEDFKKDLNKFRTSPRPDAEEFIKSIVACLLHLNVEDLKDVENKLNDINVKTKLIQIYGNSQDLEIETKRKEILLDSETGRIVDTLIPCDLKKMSGTMGIIRTNTIQSGNKMYKTLCIARKISSEVDYSFEIVRDYGKTRLCDDFDDDKLDQDRHERSARYRIRERMQPKKCTYTDPKTSASCSCAFRSDEIIPLSEPTMRCRKCSHVHKRIENYEDLDGLPCILILVDKGRLGNTFPQSLRVLDSRLCHTKTMGPVYFSSLVQELGRLSRHQIKSDEKPLPYTLISKHLADILRDGLHEGAPFHSLLHLPNKSRVYIDRKVDLKKGKVIPGPHAKKKMYFAKKGHFDHGNKSRDCNRILLRAEPQIGKTGVYLKVISILRKKYSSDLSDESEDEDEDRDDQAEDTEDLSLESNKKSLWVYPFWKNNKHGSKLDTNIKNGKYYPLYGGYTYGNPAPEILPQSISKKKKKKEKKMPSKELEIKSFSFREHSSCGECCVQHENDVLELSLPGNSSDSGGTINFRISVPKTRQYHVLLKYIEPFTANTLQYPIDNLDNLSDDSQCLNSWIFIPSHKRHERANVNLYHTMVTEKSGESLRCQYTTILVVRRTDFDSYCKLWQSTHVILQIPDTLPRADRDAEEGGIGFARLSIQIFAEKLGLNWIFMLDDNMPYVREIEESESLVKRENGTLIETKVPLFKVLKHIEMQVDGSVRRAPIEGFEKYTEKHPEITIKHPLEEYTGVNNNYGIIGVKKHRPTSCKVKRPFIKTHVHSLLFLNINTLKDKNVYYKPWQVFEDLTINNDCDTKGLWVCKYNRFTVLKQHMKTWIPDVYTWSEDTELRKRTEEAQNSTDILISYLRCNFTIKDVIELADNKEEDTDFEDFEHLLRDVPKETGKHKLMVIRNRDFKESTMRLQDIVKDLSFFTEGQNYFIIMMSSDLCIEEGLTKKKLIEEWLKKTLPVHRSFRFEVITSHNVGCFQVKILLVIVKVTIPYSSATSKKNQATSETLSKKRTSDAKEGRAKKLQKYDDDGAVEQNQPGTSLKDENEKLREEVATLKKQLNQVMAFIKKKNRNVNETDEENTSDGEFDV